METRRLLDEDAEQVLPQGAILNDRYEVIKILGAGGMGSVYLGRDLRFTGVGRLCAIKEMICAAPSPQFRKTSLENFQREANTLAGLDHSSIVKVFDIFSEGFRAYLVMEYIEGQNLEETLDQLPEGQFLEEERIITWGLQVCDVLSFLHHLKTPIVYRDLKPSNLMLKTNTDTIILIDFGIAKAFQEGQKGTMMGTEGYSPPEQYRGIASPQGDIYALGATLHHLLTRRDPKLEPPFTFHEVLPRQTNPHASALFEKIVMKALAYDAKERFDSATQMKLALEKTLQMKKQGVQTAMATSVLTQPAEQKIISLSQSPDSAATQVLPYSAETQVLPNNASTHVLSPEPSASRQSTQPTQAPPTPVEMPEIATGDSGIVPLWTFKCEDEIRSSPKLENGIIYIGAYDNNLYAIDANEGKFKWKYPTEGGIASTPYVYKDRVLIGSEDQQVYAISIYRGKVLWTCATEGRVRSSINVEFNHAFFGSDDGNVYAVNAQSGRVAWRFAISNPVRSSPTVDGEIIYVGCDDGHLYAINMQTGGVKWKYRTNRPIWSSPTIFEDMVIFGSQDHVVYAIDKTSGWMVWNTRTDQPVISSPTVKDDVVYVGSVDGNLYALNINSGRVIWKYKAGSQIVCKPAVSDEAVFFGTSKGEVISVSLKGGRERWRFQTQGSLPSSPALGDGVIYIGSTDHTLYALPAI